MRKTVLASLLFVFSFSAQAASRYWLPGTVGAFDQTENWLDGAYPGTGDSANMDVGSATISEGMDIKVGYFNVARTNTFAVVQTGGSVTVLSTSGGSDPGFKIGRGEDNKTTGAVGTYTLSGGTVSAPGARVAVGYWGNGTLDISGSGKLTTTWRVVVAHASVASGTINLTAGGTIEAPVIELVRTSAKLTFDGGVYRAAAGTSSSQNDMFIAGASGTYATIGNGGAVFDTIDHDCTISIPLVAAESNGSPAGIEKVGSGILRLTAANTYAGPTVVSEGARVAMTADALPNYGTAGMLTVKSGASLILGSAWTAEQIAALRAAAIMEDGAGIGYDTSGGDITISENLNLSSGLEKLGANTLFLTGANTFGGHVKVHAGTLQADFGQGLDANRAVELLGGALSSASGSITSGLGTGAGQIAVSSSYTPAFTAKGVPLTVKLGNTDEPIAFGSGKFPSLGLILNSAEANQPITFENALNVNGKTAAITVNKGTATITGMVTNSTAECTLEKRGAGTLSLEGANRIRRLNAYAGTTILDSRTKNVFGMVNILDGATIAATNQTISVTNNLNVKQGTLVLKDCVVTNVQTFCTGNDVAYNAKAKKIAIDGGTIYGTSLYAGNATKGNGDIEIANGANVSFSQIFVRGGTITQSGATVTARSSGNAIRIGENTNGVYRLDGGNLNCGYHFQIGAGKGLGIYQQTGGTNTVLGVCSIGWGASSTGEVYVTGGVLREPVAKNFRVGESGVGYIEVNVAGEVLTGDTRLSIAHEGQTGAAGRVMLGCGGTIEATEVAGHNGKNGMYSEFFFNGGTLRATATAPNKFLYNLTAFGMGELGGTVDTNGRDISFKNALVASESLPVRGAGMTHRWSFNGNLEDSIGGQTATATGGTFVNNSSEISLTGGKRGASCVNLGKNVLPNDGSAATIELWATQRTIQNWSRIFDFGSGSKDYLVMAWTKGTDINTDMVRIYSAAFPSISNAMAPYTLNTEFHIAMTFEPLEDGNWQVTAYKQDAATGETLKKTAFTTSGGWSLRTQGQNNCYLGRSVQTDNDASANYNEVRIWNRALSEAELTANALAGPDTLSSRAFEKRGEGRLTLSGANTYAVDTRVAGGTLALDAGASLPESTRVELLPDTGLDLGGNTQTIAGLSGTGTVLNGSLAVTDEINPGTDPGEAAALTLSQTVLSGKLTLDATEDAVDRIVCTSGVLDLSGLELEIGNLAALTPGMHTIATSADGFIGRFSSENNVVGQWMVCYQKNRVSLTRRGTLIMLY